MSMRNSFEIKTLNRVNKVAGAVVVGFGLAFSAVTTLFRNG